MSDECDFLRTRLTEQVGALAPGQRAELSSPPCGTWEATATDGAPIIRQIAAPWTPPGTALTALLSRLGFRTCSRCALRAAEMNRRGLAWCEANIDTILGWLREEATTRNLPFAPLIARLLILHALQTARRAPATRRINLP